MKPSSKTVDEKARLAALKRYEILDTECEESYDDLARLAAQLCNSTIATIGFIDEERQWFKSTVGLEISEVPREQSISNRILHEPGVSRVENVRKNHRFRGLMLAKKPFSIQFYAGVPIVTPDGHAVGVLAVMDRKPRRLTKRQERSLEILSRQVTSQMELRLHLLNAKEALKAQKQTEAELRFAESKYHGIFDNVVEGIFQTAPDGHYLSANRMLAKIYGYESPDELIAVVNSIDTQLYVDPRRRDQFVELLNEKDTLEGFVSQVHRKDGSTIWISENARAVRDETGRLHHYEGTVEDISHRRAAEEALRNSEALYHSLVDNLPQNIFRKDLDGRFTFGNKRFCETLGTSPEELLGKTDFDFFPPELARKFQDDDRRILTTLKPFETIEENVTTSHVRIFVHTVKTPLHDADGNVIGVQGIFWDVTERKKIEETLKFERGLHQALMDSSPDRIFFKDTNSRLIKCSQALVKFLGYEKPEDVIGKSDRDFFPSEQAEEFMKDERFVMRTGQPIINKIEHHTDRSGAPSWASVTKFPLWNRKGQITGLVGISRDITQIKLAEEELAAARDSALESARAKSEFLANVSHEIRTPMNAIIGMAALLSETELNEEQDNFTSTIANSAEALLSIVNDILDFSKMEAGKLTLEQIDFELAEVVEGTVDIFAERARNKDIELISIVRKDVPPHLIGDPGRLRQILINLVNNAVKFTEHGQVITDVSLCCRKESLDRLRFEIRDTGIGIPQETVPRLFQAFTQADGSMARRFGGTGLGLAIVKEIVDLMKGEVGVTSAPGVGSTFWIEVPFRVPDAAPESVRDFTPLAGMRCLVLARHEALGDSISDLLRSYNCEVDVHADNNETTDVVRSAVAAKKPFDVLILERERDTERQLTWLLELQEATSGTDLPIILLSDVGVENISANLLANIVARLTKPIRLSRLVEILRRLRTGESITEPRSQKDAAEEAQAIPGFRILLAEDNPVNTDLAQRQFRKLGYDIDCAVNGLEVIRSIEEREYDAIFMDCQMPEMDGYTATRLIRQYESLKKSRRTYIIAMTANALVGDRERCLEAGMDDYMSKPVRINELRTVIHRAADGKSAEAPVKPSAPPAEPEPETVNDADIPSLDEDIIQGLLSLCTEGDTSALDEMSELFASDTESRIAKIEAAIEASDPAALRAVAHALKGSSSNFGARRMANFCLLIEEASDNGDDDAIRANLAALKAEFETVKSRLAAYSAQQA